MCHQHFGDDSVVVSVPRATRPKNLILLTSGYAQAKEMSHPSLPRESCDSILAASGQARCLPDGSPFSRTTWPWAPARNILLSTGGKKELSKALCDAAAIPDGAAEPWAPRWDGRAAPGPRDRGATLHRGWSWGSEGAQGMRQHQEQPSQDRKPGWFPLHSSLGRFLVCGCSAV